MFRRPTHIMSLKNQFTSQKIEKPLDWRDRPNMIKDKIQNVWSALKDKASTWYYNGENDYQLAGINSYALLKKIIKQNPERNDFYILDIGAGEFNFSRNIVCKLNNDKELPKNIKIHVISVRGEISKEEAIQENGICKIYNFGYFQIENLIDELLKRNLDLNKKIDVIVSRWTFRHLVDPVGTFLQAYSLLKPISGLLLIDGFILHINNTSCEYTNFYRFLTYIKAPVLTFGWTAGRCLNQYVLKRPDDNECQLPFSYEGLIENMSDSQINSNSITLFKSSLTFNNVDSYEVSPINYTGNEELYNYISDALPSDLMKRKKQRIYLYNGDFQISDPSLNNTLECLGFFNNRTRSLVIDYLNEETSNLKVGQP